MVGGSDTWWKYFGNELGRHDNGIDNQVSATNTMNLSESRKYQKFAQSHMLILCVFTAHLNQNHTDAD